MGIFVREFPHGSVCMGMFGWERLYGNVCMGMSGWVCPKGSVWMGNVLFKHEQYIMNQFQSLRSRYDSPGFVWGSR
jgi:hypothetical protein